MIDYALKLMRTRSEQKQRSSNLYYSAGYTLLFAVFSVLTPDPLYNVALAVSIAMLGHYVSNLSKEIIV